MQRTDQLSGFATALLLTVVAMPAFGADVQPNFALEVGTEWTTGDYGGDAAVEELYVPVTAVLDLQRVSLRLTLPYLSVRAPELAWLPGPDGTPVLGQGDAVTEGGLGDIQLSATLFDLLRSSGGSTAVDITGKVKFGTADVEQGLGTGEDDFAVQLDAFHFFDRMTAFATAGYWWRSSPDAYPIENQAFASLGASVPLVRRGVVGGAVDYRQSSIADTDDATEITAWFEVTMSPSTAAALHVLAGFGDSAPEWGVGFTIRGAF